MTQAARVYGAADPDHLEDLRDEFLADNVESQLSHEPAGTRMLLWAHNGHIALRKTDGEPMGQPLRQRFGRDYLSVGFLFGQGEFRTFELRDGRAVTEAHTYGPPPVDDIAAPFAATHRRGLIVDLRTLPSGVVGAWFHQARPMREVGGTYMSEADAPQPAILPSELDVVVYVDRMTLRLVTADLRGQPLQQLPARAGQP